MAAELLQWNRDLKKRDNELNDRRKAATDTKAALLEKFRAAQSDPEREVKLAERVALAAAREERQAERDRLKAEEQERLKREEAERLAALEAAARAEAEEREAADKLRISRVIEDEAARKAERDRRYAARKARSA
ncbi:MAG: hypothetical protein JWL86_704 [Rhizobium sp.]|nr:hypothetical protein [Rhizobium sp.]